MSHLRDHGYTLPSEVNYIGLINMVSSDIFKKAAFFVYLGSKENLHVCSCLILGSITQGNSSTVQGAKMEAAQKQVNYVLSNGFYRQFGMSETTLKELCIKYSQRVSEFNVYESQLETYMSTDVWRTRADESCVDFDSRLKYQHRSKGVTCMSDCTLARYGITTHGFGNTISEAHSMSGYQMYILVETYSHLARLNKEGKLLFDEVEWKANIKKEKQKTDCQSLSAIDILRILSRPSGGPPSFTIEASSFSSTGTGSPTKESKTHKRCSDGATVPGCSRRKE